MKRYDLEERTEDFSCAVISFCRGLGNDPILRPMIGQLVRSATSVGANYKEANSASSKKDFKNKIHICKKEAEETCYWLRLIAKADDKHKESAYILEGEVHEFVLIFGKIISTISSQGKS